MIKSTENEFPREIIMKIVYKNKPAVLDSIKTCLDSHNIKNSVDEKVSGKSNYISYTIKGYFDNEDSLNTVCYELKTIDGFMMMF